MTFSDGMVPGTHFPADLVRYRLTTSDRMGMATQVGGREGDSYRKGRAPQVFGDFCLFPRLT